MDSYAAVFDGKVFVPEEPVDLSPNSRVRVTVEPVDEAEATKSKRHEAFSKLLENPAHSGGVDWAELDRGELYP